MAETTDPLSSYPHTLIDQGRMWHCSTSSASLADGDSLDMIISPPPGDFIGMLLEGACGGDAEFLFYEGVVFTGGSVETVYNLKRTVNRQWRGTMTTGATVSSPGTLLSTQFLPGGQKNQAAGASGTIELPWILNVNKVYLVRLTNRAGGAKRASIGCNHYSSPFIPDDTA
jgi:hypothetical protein